ncbi:ABC transporter ATP-binding protein [Paenibacillus eucommiae]|uniref:Multiple sugar transport system ATP-binding protein n=1 Tax=Paenibacillus eucommiae TaxID=1355755 RepID=A0ABS4J1G8_9BACL|nr:sn-glycerol-3-phosphate ABC transporter ATP-binding protein UgpC [Paenibacillus eucommiae]MBP1993106.1 multiple sugar transport system ATP-binding protein [Paenibacillus eucommiae]
MGTVTFHHVHKSYKGEAQASVKDFHLEINDGEFLVLVGPSGCGKSTTLRMLAGLEEITSGDIFIDHRLINYVSPKNRDIAMVFQNYSLYPNLSVYGNISLGLKLRKMAKHEIELKVNRVARILEISHLLDKLPHQLSGGQKQRVALGRAIVREPKVFLMDEPLSNLDAKLRAQTRAEIIRMHERMKTTIVYVTHDQVEAMTMGTRIVVMKSGEIQQVSTPQEVYDYPNNLFVAGFIGTPQMNFVSGSVTFKDGRYYFENNRWKLPLPAGCFDALARTSSNLRHIVLGLRPEHVQLEAEQKAEKAEWMIPAQVEMKELMGPDTYVSVRIGSLSSAERAVKTAESYTFTLRADPHTPVQVGDHVLIQLLLNKAHLFDGETGHNIARKGEEPAWE